MEWIKDHWPFAVVGAVGLLLSFFQLRTWFLRRRKSYQELLDPELKAHGFEFISSRTPSLFNVGPFPAIEVEPQPYSSSYGPTGSGHYRQYRIVKFGDKMGVAREAWALIRFEFWKLKSISWNPDLCTFEKGNPNN
jgi:hypothetical protein